MKSIKHIILLTILALLFVVEQAWCIKVAVFPVDDLSKEHNSISTQMTDFLITEVSKKGLDVVDIEQVMLFMNQKRIRHLGSLQTQEIMATRNDLDADLILLASLCQLEDSPTSVGMTVTLVRTSDGHTIWANTQGVSQAGEQHFLGRNTPDSTNDILPVLAGKLFSDWPSDLDFTAGREIAGTQIAAVQETSYVQVDSVFFSPKYVRPGQKVTCTIRFKNLYEHGSEAKVFIKVGNRVHLAQSEDGKYFQAAWVGSEGKIGNRLQVASNDPQSSVFNGVWSGDLQDADYPVSLILDWPSGKKDESYLGSYIVDSKAPEFFFKITAKHINGVAAFRDSLPINIRFKRREPISKWEFSVLDQDGKVVLFDRGQKTMPEKFFWSGQNNKNIRSDSGLYTIMLKLWDRAGNSNQTQEQVMLLERRPAAEINLTAENESISANITAVDDVPVTYWRMELWSTTNKLLATQKGNSLPAQVDLSQFSKIDNDGIECILSIRDSFGSKSKKKINDLFSMLSVSDNEDEFITEPQSDDDIWQADF